MPISAKVSATIPLPVNAVFERVVHMDVPAFFNGRWPIAAVVSVRDQLGQWNKIGETRSIHMADGSHITECITDYRASELFAYQLQGLTGPLRQLVKSIDGEWRYSSQGEQLTRIDWCYQFHPRNLLISPLTWLFVKLLWKPYMKQVMQSIEHKVNHP